MSFLESSISVSVQQTPQFEQRIADECFGEYLCFYLGCEFSDWDFHQVHVEHLCPSDVLKRYTRGFVVAWRRILD
jgi:hypothetical protein